MRNWEVDAQDNDVFVLLQRDANEDMLRAKAFFLKHFTPEKLVKIGRVRPRKGDGDGNSMDDRLTGLRIRNGRLSDAKGTSLPAISSPSAKPSATSAVPPPTRKASANPKRSVRSSATPAPPSASEARHAKAAAGIRRPLRFPFPPMTRCIVRLARPKDLR